MSIQLLTNGIPHDAIILTKSNSLAEYSSSKVLSIPYSSVYPWEVEIHLTGTCCLSCNGCSYSTRHSKDSLSSDDLEGIFRSLKNMKCHTVFFSGGGDPLSWDNWEMLMTLKKELIPDIITGISTNLVTSQNCCFIDRFFDYVQVHIVGYDVDSCIANTGVDCFATVDKQLSQIKNQNVVLKMLINSSNYHLLPKYLSYMERFDARTIVIKLEQDFITNRQIIHDDVFEQLISMVENHQITSKFHSLFHTRTEKQLLYMPSMCHVVDKHMYCLIRENGDVYPCIASAYSKTNAIGNIRVEKLEEIYTHNIDSEKFTKQMKSGECPLYACRHFRFNRELDINISDSKDHNGFVSDLL